MNRPYVICHMTVSLDGKVTGEHLVRSNHSPASEVYYEINRNYKADCLRLRTGHYGGQFHQRLVSRSERV